METEDRNKNTPAPLHLAAKQGHEGVVQVSSNTFCHKCHQCVQWMSRNLMIRIESWQTTVSIIIIVVSASRLFLEVLELFQVVIDIL